MESIAAVRLLRERLRDELVVSSLGTPSYFVNAAGDRPLNFYLWAAMGMASSVGLGLAIARPDRRVVVVDGDDRGSLRAAAAQGREPLELHP